VTALVGALVALPAFTGDACAHGPVAPAATSFLARVHEAPSGVRAKVVDGDLRMWLEVSRAGTVEVLDYRGAPYLRFSASGVYVNERSEMYYLNQVPPLPSPRGLSPTAAPRWSRIGSGHEYDWHDGRIAALTATAIAPGASYVGTWSIPVLVNGRLEVISGGLWHAPDPSPVWLWLIAVLLGCLLAAWRVDRVELDTAVAGALTVVLAVAIAGGCAARQLYGRPGVPTAEVLLAAIVGVFAALGVVMTVVRRGGYLLQILIAFVALWVGLELLPTLLHGFALTAGPPLLARVTAVVCLGGCADLALLGVRGALRTPGGARRSPAPGPFRPAASRES
jgi:hypothetical protein